ncbi:unnamed protein product, partial [Phaeothamnion confervicola]
RRFLHLRPGAGLLLRAVRRRQVSNLSPSGGLAADTVWLPPGRQLFPRRGRGSYLVVRRDGRLAIYTGAGPPQATAAAAAGGYGGYDPQVGDSVAAWVDLQ